MVFFGYIERVHRGEIFQSAMVNTVQFLVDFTDGELSDYGNEYGKISCNKLMLLEILTLVVQFVDSTIVRAHQHAE